MICSTHQANSKWYHYDGRQKRYISKKSRRLAEQLARKKYLSLLLDDLEHEKRALDIYLRRHAPSGKAEKLLTNYSEYQHLLHPYFQPVSRELSDWMNTPYEQNKQYPENLVHKTLAGSFVRSKSELIIDMSLRMHKIPFRYECALLLSNIVIYPDFTLRHPTTGEYFYWEHFGLMDQAAYMKNAYAKLTLYTSNGIVPGIHLITTYETKENPLSTEAVEKLIEYFFL